jgi:hypothetical protein
MLSIPLRKPTLMAVKITFENLKSTLKAIQDQHISISIQNKDGKWTNEYFCIADIRHFSIGGATLEALILYTELDSPGAIIELRSIYGLKLNKFLNLNGDLIQEVTVGPRKFNEVLTV